jgi:hypothetical protein
MRYLHKYLKYKTKYLQLKKMVGGNDISEEDLLGELKKVVNTFFKKKFRHTDKAHKREHKQYAETIQRRIWSYYDFYREYSRLSSNSARGHGFSKKYVFFAEFEEILHYFIKLILGINVYIEDDYFEVEKTEPEEKKYIFETKIKKNFGEESKLANVFYRLRNENREILNKLKNFRNPSEKILKLQIIAKFLFETFGNLGIEENEDYKDYEIIENGRTEIPGLFIEESPVGSPIGSPIASSVNATEPSQRRFTFTRGIISDEGSDDGFESGSDDGFESGSDDGFDESGSESGSDDDGSDSASDSESENGSDSGSSSATEQETFMTESESEDFPLSKYFQEKSTSDEASNKAQSEAQSEAQIATIRRQRREEKEKRRANLKASQKERREKETRETSTKRIKGTKGQPIDVDAIPDGEASPSKTNDGEASPPKVIIDVDALSQSSDDEDPKSKQGGADFYF